MAAGSENERDTGQRASSALTWINLLFGGIGLVLVPWAWGAASRSHPGWSWGFLGAAAGFLVAYMLLHGRDISRPRKRAAISLGIACAAVGGFVALAQRSDGEEAQATPQQSAPVPPTSESTSPPSDTPTTPPPATPDGSDAWTSLDPTNIVVTDDMSVDCGAFYDWEGPKEIVVDRIEMEEGFDVGGSCNGGVEVRASFVFEDDAAGFRVAGGILKDSSDPGPVPVSVLPNEDESQEVCEGNVRVGHPLELTMDISSLSRVTIVAYLPERLTDADQVIGIGNAEVTYAAPEGNLPSCGAAFELD